MSRVKVLVVEDEAIIADDIVSTLDEFGYDVLEPANTYSAAIETIEEERPDVAILDIQLSGKKSGIDIAIEINKKHHFPFIFLSSNSDKITLEQAKNVQPFAYLVKPFGKEELYTSIEVALYNYAKQQEKALDSTNLIIENALFIKDNKAFYRIDFSDILFLKSDHIYIDVYLKEGKKVTVRGSLNEYMGKLSKSFFRSHRSYIVNLDFMTKLEHNKMEVGGQEVLIGQNQREELLQRLNRG